MCIRDSYRVGVLENVLDFAYTQDKVAEINMKREIQSVQIPDEYFKMQYMDMKTGLDDGKYYEKIYEDDTKYFNISMTNSAFTYDPATNIIRVNPGDEPVSYTHLDVYKRQASIRGMHILLAEDNELNMEIAEFMLQNEGAVVTKAWNGQEAVELFEKSRSGEFDVILMDIMMPVMNGYEATKMIRSLDREDAKEVPIIAMTANACTEDRIRAKEAGMDEHVAKPVDGELLAKVIHKLVS